ncbi:MAG: glycoside hydrolase family 3 N-terminal domain-containing protein [Muribaculaceae bacterium]
MNRIVKRLVLSMVVVMTGVVTHATTGILARVDKTEMNRWVDSVMNTMNEREKVAQLMVVTFLPNDSPELYKRLDHLVGECHIGGLLFSKGEIVNQAKATNYAQSKSSVPLMITLDGEWGPAMRMPDAPLFPRNMILGAITDERLLYRYGAEVARECRELGIHVNFAPVLDVNDNPKNPVIGNRSFGEIPERVASLSIAYSKGLEDNGVLSTAKHFPGHGSTSTDSHKTLPTVNKSFSELTICELLPFRRYFEAGLSGVMVGHLSVPAIDRSGVPTSLSSKTNELLRHKMGFDGLIFTDALTMNGAKTEGSTAVKALLAGDDVLLSLPEPEKQIDYVLDAVKKGIIKQGLIDEKCRKMLRYKYALGLWRNSEIDIEGLVNRVNSPEANALIHRLVAASMTVVKNHGKAWPVKHLEKTKIAVVTMGDSQGANSMFRKRCANYAQVDSYNYTGTESIAELREKLKSGGYNMVIMAVHSNSEANRVALSNIVTAVKHVSAALFISPYQAARFASSLKHCESVLMAYENTEMTQDYAAQAIFGGIDVSGALPVSIAGLAKAGTGVKYGAIRLGYTVPEEVGVDSKMLSQMDNMAREAIRLKAFSGLQVLVARHGKVICNRNYGYTDNSKTRSEVDDNTIFDLASVTKATGTLAGLMKCYDDSGFELDDEISKYITPLKDTDKEDLTIKDLLFHESGMPAALVMPTIMFDRKSYQGSLIRSRRRGDNTIKLYNRAFGNRKARLRSDLVKSQREEGFDVEAAKGLYVGKSTCDTIMQRIYRVKLHKNKNFRYSCLNFCLLLDAEQRITGEEHDKYVEKHVFAPLGAYCTGYRPLEWADVDEVVATEYDSFLRRQQLKGYVHDEMACMMGGVAGNAGLFGNAIDLAKLMQMWLNGGEYGGHRFLKKETVDLFMTTKSDNSRRGLGFDKPNMKNPDKSPACKSAPAEVIGHTGYTGTAFWVDPKNDMIFIFLCNRVYPTRNNAAFTKLDVRKKMQEAVYVNLIGD